MIGWIILAVLVAMAAAAPRYGVDTRVADSGTTGTGSAPVAPAGPRLRSDLVTMGRALTGLAHRVGVGH